MTDPHPPAAPLGTDERGIERRVALPGALGKELWPADRDTLVARSQEGSATDTIISQPSGLPEGRDFANVRDVARALGHGTRAETVPTCPR